MSSRAEAKPFAAKIILQEVTPIAGRITQSSRVRQDGDPQDRSDDHPQKTSADPDRYLAPHNRCTRQVWENRETFPSRQRPDDGEFQEHRLVPRELGKSTGYSLSATFSVARMSTS